MGQLTKPFPEVSPFKKYSQFGEDGYLDYILKQIGISEFPFVLDIGAGDPDGNSNSRYFIEALKFNYLLIDGATKHQMVANLFVTAENILPFLQERRVPKSFDVLSLDIDGNDYYILEKLMQSDYRPNVIVAEINPIFEINQAMVMKYNPEHSWTDDDYYGMSLAAATMLLKEYGYSCVFCSDSLNAYFVRNHFLNLNTIWEINYTKKNDHPHREGEWINLKKS